MKTAPSPRALKSPSPLFRQLAESDHCYFTLGASHSTLSGLDLWHMQGFESSPSAAVVWNIQEGGASATLDEARLALLHEELRGLGRTVSRIYMPDPPDREQAERLLSLGYSQRQEVLMCAPVDTILRDVPCPSQASLQLVRSENDWAEKEALYRGSDAQPDGYATLAAAWNNLEKEKGRQGGMDSFLVRYGKEAVGAVSLISRGTLGRLKNLFVSPAARNQGVGVATVALLAAEARQRGCNDLGCFALAGEAGERVYRKAGMQPLGSVSEFSKRL